MARVHKMRVFPGGPLSNDLVLLIEDNPDDEELMLSAIRENRVSARVVTVRDGQEALDWLFGEGNYGHRDTAVQPRVILLDLKLPKRSGHEVLACIRTDPRTKHVPVVVLTSSNAESDKVRAYDLAANSYVVKPVNFDSFLSVASDLGRYWLTVNETPG